MANTGSGSRQAAWEFFGAELKRYREAAELSQEALGQHVFVSGAYISHFETGGRKPQLDVAQRIDETLRTDGVFERMCRKLINDRRYADYFAAAAELETLATRICEWAPTLVPGLLQTAEYARAITVATNPFAPDEYIEEKVSARMDRAHLLKNPAAPAYWAILHEHVLRLPVGGPQGMATQLDHLAALARSRRVLLQVLPFSAGAYALPNGTLTLMEFEDAPPTAYTEAVFSGNLLDDPALVKRVQGAYDLLRVAALSPEASLALIESAAEGLQTMPEYDLSTARWHKSSYSDGNGGSCVEVAYDFSGAAWRKSTYSNGEGGDCLEVADGLPGVVPVRDSKVPHGPALVFPAAGWRVFVGTLKDGGFAAA